MSNQYKRLYRKREGRMIGGVCAGLGEYLGIDPTVVRLLFVLLAIGGVGGGILAYLVMLLVVPEEPMES
jgi:phage shock protein C